MLERPFSIQSRVSIFTKSQVHAPSVNKRKGWFHCFVGYCPNGYTAKRIDTDEDAIWRRERLAWAQAEGAEKY